MRLSVFLPESSPQLLIDLQKLYKGYLTKEQLTNKSLQEMINDDNKLIFVTLFNARHLGAVQVSIQQNRAQLIHFCVRDITRRRGVGKNLLNQVEKQLKERGVSEVQLTLNDIRTDEQQGLKIFMETCGYQSNQQQLSKRL